MKTENRKMTKSTITTINSYEIRYDNVKYNIKHNYMSKNNIKTFSNNKLKDAYSLEGKL